MLSTYFNLPQAEDTYDIRLSMLLKLSNLSDFSQYGFSPGCEEGLHFLVLVLAQVPHVSEH